MNMQLTIHAKGKNARNISYLLGKNPDNPFEKTMKYGKVECKFLTYEEEEVKVYYTFLADGLALVKQSDYHHLEDYINDREFSLSSIFLSNIRTTIGYVFSGTKEGVDELFDFTVSLSPIATKLPDDVLEALFAPLGFDVTIQKIETTNHFKIKSGRVVDITLRGTTSIGALFKQLFVLIPVMDNYKHYYISQDEADKLLRYGDGWLETHPKKQMITQRFVGYKKSLVQGVLEAIEQPTETEQAPIEDVKTKTPLGKLRYSKFEEVIASLGVTSVVDMGAGEGRLLELFVKNTQLQEIFACEPTIHGIERMKRLTEKLRENGKLKVEPTIVQSSLFYLDERLVGKEAMVLCEVIEHIEPERIDSVLSNLLSFYQPTYFLFSTPNYEYNEVYGLNGKFRHNDHRFEMTREEFTTFAQKHAKNNGYTVQMVGIGEEHASYGFPTQMAILTKNSEG